MLAAAFSLGTGAAFAQTSVGVSAGGAAGGGGAAVGITANVGAGASTSGGIKAGTNVKASSKVKARGVSTTGSGGASGKIGVR